MFISNNKFSGIKNDILLYFLIVVFIIFGSIPLRFFTWIHIFPNIALSLIFYYMIIRNNEANYIILFLFGILFDVFNNCLLGTSALTLLLSAKLISVIRSHLYISDSFLTIFRDFVIFAFLNSIIQWFTLNMFDGNNNYPFLNSFWQFFINLITFAMLYKILKKSEDFL